MADIISAFVRWFAPRLGISLDDKPYGLWAHAVEETQDGANVSDPVSVIRTYPGGTPLATAPTGHALVQCYTRGTRPVPTMERAFTVDAALRDSYGLPVVQQLLDGYRLASVGNIKAPGILGRDEKLRIEIVSNFELFYTRL